MQLVCTLGGNAVAVPGQIKGMEYAWRRFGNLTWKELFEDAINIAENGFEVTDALCYAARETLSDMRYSGQQLNFPGL